MVARFINNVPTFKIIKKISPNDEIKVFFEMDKSNETIESANIKLLDERMNENITKCSTKRLHKHEQTSAYFSSNLQKRALFEETDSYKTFKNFNLSSPRLNLEMPHFHTHDESQQHCKKNKSFSASFFSDVCDITNVSARHPSPSFSTSGYVSPSYLMENNVINDEINVIEQRMTNFDEQDKPLDLRTNKAKLKHTKMPHPGEKNNDNDSDCTDSDDVNVTKELQCKSLHHNDVTKDYDDDDENDLDATSNQLIIDEQHMNDETDDQVTNDNMDHHSSVGKNEIDEDVDEKERKENVGTVRSDNEHLVPEKIVSGGMSAASLNTIESGDDDRNDDDDAGEDDDDDDDVSDDEEDNNGDDNDDVEIPLNVLNPLPKVIGNSSSSNNCTDIRATPIAGHSLNIFPLESFSKSSNISKDPLPSNQVFPVDQKKSKRRCKTWLPCDVCGKKFDRPSLLQRHIRTHTGEKPHVCDVCSKAFSTSSSLNTHRRIHSGEKPHECPICGKKFTASSNLYYHRMTHRKEKPHKCTQCSRSFPTPGDLKNHLYTHTGTWPFTCSVCHRGFTKASNFKNHMIFHLGPEAKQCVRCEEWISGEVNQISDLCLKCRSIASNSTVHCSHSNVNINSRRTAQMKTNFSSIESWISK